MKIDLNCDMGELEDAAHEAALMAFVTSANIACGAHAGDLATMERTARLALERGVRIGAHPGYPDRENFGRLELAMSAEAVAQTVCEQIVLLDGVVTRLGGSVAYVKPHGALYNVAVHNAAVARAIAEGAARWNPGDWMTFALDVWSVRMKFNSARVLFTTVATLRFVTPPINWPLVKPFGPVTPAVFR